MRRLHGLEEYYLYKSDTIQQQNKSRQERRSQNIRLIENQQGVAVAEDVKRSDLIAEAKSISLPIVLDEDGMVYLNKAAQEAQPTPEVLAKELTKAQEVVAKSNAPDWVKRFWNALEIKPGIFGIRLDVKKAMGWGEWK
jgi:hypothetical protein